MLKRFGVPLEGLELKIESRGAPPLGGGEVVLGVPTVPNSLTVSSLCFLLVEVKYWFFYWLCLN